MKKKYQSHQNNVFHKNYYFSLKWPKDAHLLFCSLNCWKPSHGVGNKTFLRSLNYCFGNLFFFLWVHLCLWTLTLFTSDHFCLSIFLLRSGFSQSLAKSLGISVHLPGAAAAAALSKLFTVSKEKEDRLLGSFLWNVWSKGVLFLHQHGVFAAG